ncbi:hypothetical protein [Catellatospora sp. NPDC049133]|uniref:hypothetical protein n=1 Tax=Catellatospora sp. NPDC049133 TaxID=3155499 RepID=UPI0033F353E5
MQESRTLLRRLIDARRLSYPEVIDVLDGRARAMGANQFTLSRRQLIRMINGEVGTRPMPVTCRVLEAEFGHPVDALLGPAGASLPAVDEDRSLEQAAQASASYAMWQGVDGIAVSTLQITLGQLAQQYVYGEMLPVVAGVNAVRAAAVELLPRAGSFQRTLYLIAGLSSAMLAHAAGNLGQISQAPVHANAAMRFADLARLPGVGAWALAVRALQQEWSGSPQRSVVTARQAREMLPSGSADSTQVWLAAIEARAYARLGNAAAVRDSLDQAARCRELIAARPADDAFGVDQFGGIVAFVEAKEDYYAGTALRRIGDVRQARERSTAAIRAYEQGPADMRSYGDETLARLDLAIAFAQGPETDLEAVSAALEPVTRLPDALLLPPLQGHLAELAAAVSRADLRGSRHAAHVRSTAMALSTLCAPPPAQLTT